MDQCYKASPAEVYEDYLVPGVHDRWACLLLNYARPAAGEHVLDLACGTGIVARRIAPYLGPDGRVLGLDISADMLAVANRQAPPPGAPITWVQGEAASLPEGPFDLVTCQQGVQFFADRAAALRETRRVLRPGGRCVLNVFRDLERQSLYRPLFEAVARHVARPVEELATPYSLGSADALRALLLAAGYDQVEIAAEACFVRFPSPERFLALTVAAAAAVIPEFGADPAARANLVDAVRQDIGGLLDQFVEDNVASFPMSSHIAVAR